jgi:hypothetical protein
MGAIHLESSCGVWRFESTPVAPYFNMEPKGAKMQDFYAAV